MTGRADRRESTPQFLVAVRSGNRDMEENETV
jgi:hypothetical protein